MLYNFLATLQIMKKLRVTTLLVLGILVFAPGRVFASAPPKLVISQFKVTSSDGQFFMLYNATEQSIDMASVQLIYYNHYNLASASSSKVIPLSGTLASRGYYLINDGPLTMCYRMVVNSLSLGLSSTAGSVQVVRVTQTSPGAPVTGTVEDSVSWSKTAVTGINQLPPTGQFLLRKPVDMNNNPTISEPGTGNWQTVVIDSSNPCLLTSSITSAPAPIISTSLLLLSTTPPPVSILSIPATENAGPSLPAADIGLMAPVINELLPNPGSPATDANDEFIELYNPNDKPFDLTGFQFEVGVTTKYSWKFPDSTQLPGKSFTTFTSAQTGLSLSNTAGQARLLDPFGNTISNSEEYGSVKEDQAWALANNEWYFTVQPTPGRANVIGSSQSGATKAKSKTAATGVKSVKNVASATAGTPESNSLNTVAPEVAQLHPSALASVAVLAVGYGAYEYKQDITNRLRRLRADRAASRALSGKP